MTGVPSQFGMQCAAYACDPAHSRGRRYDESESISRNAFQRDRDRIVHSSAFRRLVYKTQVFLNHEGDLFRTRLTHSLEVAQLARSVARRLALHEDLVESIALAHDLGHTPFGHAGQDALNACMAQFGGFEHNLQSLRVVDVLEQRYPYFDGLNLCFETREGILKHCARRHALELEALEPQGVAWRFLHGGQPSLEAQLCNLADAIAYTAHDLDDGLRSGLINLEQVLAVPLIGRLHAEVVLNHPQLPLQDGRRLVYALIRQLQGTLVDDLVRHSRSQLEQTHPGSVDEVRALPALLGFSPDLRLELQALQHFLMQGLYRHAQVLASVGRAAQRVQTLFACYQAEPHEMRGEGERAADWLRISDADRARRIADYIAGMTDRFALREYDRLAGESS